MKIPSTGVLVWPAPREAGEYSMKFHYTGQLPASKLIVFGVWIDGRFVGTVIFSRGACKDLATRFGLRQTQAVELTRIALDEHSVPVTRIVAIALRLLKRLNPGLEAVFSYSDPAQSHNGHTHDGTIYRAGNWLPLGMTAAESSLRINGRLCHARTVVSRYGTRSVAWLRANVDANAERVITPPKFRFAYPITAEARERLQPFVNPYPKANHATVVSAEHAQDCAPGWNPLSRRADPPCEAEVEFLPGRSNSSEVFDA